MENYLHQNNSDSPQGNYENISSSVDYENFIQNFERPLVNETSILRYNNLIHKQNSDCQLLCDFEQEVKNISSGYYLNIDESLNIFKQYHDFETNPFIDLHKSSLEYISYLQKQNNSHETPEYFTQNSEILDASVSENVNDMSLFNTSQTALETPVKTVEVNEMNAKRQRKMKKVKKSSENKENKMTLKKTSTPTKSQEPLHYLPLSPILPPYQQNLSSQEYQIKFSEEAEKLLLEEFEKKFEDAVFKENGKTFYPISTNRDFHGFSYSVEQEMRNNFIIQTEIFCKYYRRFL